LRIKRLLGYARPELFLAAFLFPLAGFVASPARFSPTETALRLLALFIGASGLLWGGSNMLTAAFEKDELPPAGLSFSGISALAIAVLGFFLFGSFPGRIALLSALISLVYAMPLLGRNSPRGKDVPLFDLLLYAGNIGILAFLLGYGITGAEPSSRLFYLTIGFALIAAGTYPAVLVAGAERHPNYTRIFGSAWSLRIASVYLLGGAGLVATELALPLFAPFLAFYALTAAAAFVLVVWSFSPKKNAGPRRRLALILILASRGVWVLGEYLGAKA